MPAEFRFPRPFALRPGGKPLLLDRPAAMGILNLNSDSFFTGSRLESEKALLERAASMLAQGAAILDLGVQSSRPGARTMPAGEEEDRLLAGLQTLRKAFPDAILSVDCFRSELAGRAIAEGADWINDISGGLFDRQMPEVIGRSGVAYGVMHLRGTFATMHEPQTYQNTAASVTTELQEAVYRARQAGITDVVADPGFGFSKKGAQNFGLLRELTLLETLETPVLVGISRKSMVYKTLGNSPEEALNGTTALHMAALLNGAHILRVHDVAAAMETITLFCALCSPE